MTDNNDSAPLVLVVEDDPDDRLLIEEAFAELNLQARLHIVRDGDDLFRYLGEQSVSPALRSPSLIILDLNMPRRDGKEVLNELKKNAEFQKIPVIVMSTSRSPQDIDDVYRLGGSSFIAKPLSFQKLVEIVDSVNTFWLKNVEFPS
jgi:CheY-like chemotaxis protein